MGRAEDLTTSQGGAWPHQAAGRIALLEVDPDLADRAEVDGAPLTVPVYRMATGPLPQAPAFEARRRLGYLLLKGLLLYEVSVCGRATAELVGPGDLVWPWPRGTESALPIDSKWMVLEQALLADLEPVESARTPGSRAVIGSLLLRSVARADAIAVERSIAAHVRVDVRVLAYLWHLADRFGVVTPEGVRLNMRLTHAVLARLVGARRPTVTTALQRLTQLGYLHRSERAFVLAGDASLVEELEQRSPARDFALPDGDGYLAADPVAR